MPAHAARSDVTPFVFVVWCSSLAWGVAIWSPTTTKHSSLDFAFGAGQRRVFADTDPDNRGSIALLERLGFRLEGRLRGEWHTHIGVRDSLIYGLLAEEWRP